MAGGYDIGPKVGIDGFAEFRKSIKAMDEDIKDFRSELKLVAAVYDENGDSMEALAAKNEVLQKTYDAQAEKVQEIQKALEKARDEYGENADATKKWQRSLTDAKTALQKTANEMGKNQKKLDDLENSTEDLKDSFEGVDEALDEAEKALKDTREAVEDLGDAAKKSSGKFDVMKVAAGNLVSGGISLIAGGVKSAISAFINLDESTEEYRTAMGKLNAAFETAGYSSEVAGEAYTELYKILGDTDSVAEASQLMAKMAKSEQDFADWTTIAAGVAGTFGDALPITSLIEAANETAKVGKVTGALADALNWAGISEDEFNEKLAACSSESARNDLIMNTLTRTYDEAAEAFEKNNEQLIKSRENQAMLDEITGRLGESVDKVKNALLEKFGPALSTVAEEAADFILSLDTEQLLENVDNTINGFIREWEKVVNNFRTMVGEARAEVYGAFGSDPDRFGNKANMSAYEDAVRANSAYYSENRGPKSASPVYLDGKKVGEILNAANGVSKIAAGMNIATIM